MGKLAGKEQEIIDKYESGLSTVQVAKQYDVAHQSIDKLLKKNGICLRSRKEATGIRFLNSINISSNLLNKVDGWMLGDGSIIYAGSKQAYFQHVSKHKEYIQYVAKLFEREGIICKTGKYFSKNSNSYYWKLYTRRTVQLKEIYDKWYLNGIKIVPSDLVIKNSTMSYWIMDDGSLNKVDNILSLHTNSFKMEECWDLIAKIKKNFGDIKANVLIMRKKYPTITINRVSYNKILDCIKCPVGCFRYKFNKKYCKKDFNVRAVDLC